MTRTVSLIVPCRNERDHIDAFIASAVRQRLPPGWSMELIVADGASDDGTADRLAGRAAAEPRLVVIENPGRIVSSGLNRALAVARGEVIIRLDVHTTYDDDYVAACLATLQRTGADNVGGPWVARGHGPWGEAIAAVFQCRWVAGGALSRSLAHDGPVDTVYLGCWPRATFDRIGGFDEALVRNQDDEHNLRLRRAGGVVWQSGSIRCAYRPRDSLAALWRQWLQYGYWKPFVMRKHGQPAAARQLVPALFVAALGGATAAAALGVGAGPLVTVSAAYAVVLVGLSAAVARGPARAGAAGRSWRVPVVIAAHHLAYGAGSLVGWWDVLRGRPGRARFSGLTR